MSKRKKRQLGRVTIAALLTLLVAMSAFTAIFLSAQNKASALDAAEWEYVRQAIDDYITSQYDAAAEGEYGFVVENAKLKERIDSNNDGTYLGEGDNAANAPILVDSLIGQTNVIPGTSARCNWNGGLGTTNCFDSAQVTTVKNRVNSHEAAGFSTDVIDYCLSGHTEAPTTGAWGFIAQTGGLGGTSTPRVYALKWGRQGWTNTYPTAQYTEENTLGAATATSSFSDATNATPCNGLTPNSELVRCTAQWAIYNGTPPDGTWGTGSIAGGNVGNGISPTGTAPNQTLAASQIVDIRGGSPASTINITGKTTVQIPVDTLFNTGRGGLDSTLSGGTTGIIFAGRTQHMSGIVAAGAKMLGYPVGTGGFLNNGMPNYNGSLDEKYVAGTAYSTIAATANDLTSGVDTTAPVVSSIDATPTDDGATITWSTNEPATSIVEWALVSGGPYTKVNDTVLHAAHSYTITGQAPGATIYYRVSSYDGQANGGTPSTEGSVMVPPLVDHNTDYVYYMPWYDNTAIWGWMGSWVVVGNPGADPVDVELRVGGVSKGTHTIAAGDSWFQLYPNLNDGMVEVICYGCKTGSDTLVVSQRAIFKNTFNEYIASEWWDLSNAWQFPWYDNTKAWGVNGAWIVIANPDTTEASVAITIGGVAIAESPVTVPAGTVVPVRVAATTNDGPVKVTAAGSQRLLVTERVLFKNSFNEVAGLPIPMIT